MASGSERSTLTSSGERSSRDRAGFLQERIVAELLDTETAYVSQLEALTERLLRPLLAAARRTRDKAAFDALGAALNALGPILGMNRRLLRDLQRALSSTLLLSPEQCSFVRRAFDAHVARGADYRGLLRALVTHRGVAEALGVRGLPEREWMSLFLESEHRPVNRQKRTLGGLLHALVDRAGQARGAAAQSQQVTTHLFTKRPFGFLVVGTPSGHVVVGVTEPTLRRKVCNRSTIISIGQEKMGPRATAAAIRAQLDAATLPVHVRFAQKSVVKGCLIIVLEEHSGKEMKRASLARGIPSDMDTRDRIADFIADKLELSRSELQFPESLSASMHRLTLVHKNSATEREQDTSGGKKRHKMARNSCPSDMGQSASGITVSRGHVYPVAAPLIPTSLALTPPASLEVDYFASLEPSDARPMKTTIPNPLERRHLPPRGKSVRPSADIHDTAENKIGTATQLRSLARTASLPAKPLVLLDDERTDLLGGIARPIYLIGYVFCDIVPFLRIYTPYVALYPRLVGAFDAILKSRSNKVLTRAVEEADLPMPPAQLLAVPIQRVPRYRLLLRELLKHTDESHPDKPELSYALQAVSGVAGEIDAAIAAQRARATLLRLQEMFDESVRLVTPSRRFLMRGTVRLLSSGGTSGEMLHLLLFNDLLLQARLQLGGRYKLVRWIPIDIIRDVRDAAVPGRHGDPRTSRGRHERRQSAGLVDDVRSPVVARGSGARETTWDDIRRLIRSRRTRSTPQSISEGPSRTRPPSTGSEPKTQMSTRPQHKPSRSTVGSLSFTSRRRSLPLPPRLGAAAQGQLPSSSQSETDATKRFRVSLDEQRGFLVECETLRDKAHWLRALVRCLDARHQTIQGRRALRQLRDAKSGSSHTSLHDVLVSAAAPVWEADTSRAGCSRCDKVFGVLRRRHHCRYCGLLVCAACSRSKRRLPARGHTGLAEKGKPVPLELRRVCDACAAVIDVRMGALSTGLAAARVPPLGPAQPHTSSQARLVAPRQPRTTSNNMAQVAESRRAVASFGAARRLAAGMAARGSGLNVASAKLCLDSLHLRRVQRIACAEAHQRERATGDGETAEDITTSDGCS